MFLRRLFAASAYTGPIFQYGIATPALMTEIVKGPDNRVRPPSTKARTSAAQG
jgi:hypothetical protein